MRLVAILFLLLIGRPAMGQEALNAETVVRQTVERFLDLNAKGALKSREARALLTSELADPEESSIGPLSGPDKIILLDEGSAVAHVLAKSADEEVDVYLTLRRNGQDWRVAAVRSLAMTGWVQASRDYLRQIPRRDAEQEAQLRRDTLILSTDRQLIDWFKANRADIEDLAKLVYNADPKAAAMKSRLGFNLAAIEDQNMVLSFGGMLDNTVGFLHRADGTTPRINEQGIREFIWVEPAGDGWFLFRTT